MNPRTSILLALLLGTPAAAQPPPGGPQPAPVETSPVELRALKPTVTVTGQVRSRAAADLSAAVAGTLAWVAEPGATMKAGEPVARLDTDELELQRLEQRARVKRGEIQFSQLTREAERLSALESAVSRLQLDQATSARDLAAADLDIARATLKQIEKRIDRAQFRAPFDGVVADRLKRAGEEVGRGEIVSRLLDPATLEVQLFLPLRHVSAIRAGDTVQVTVSGETRPAKVRAIVPAGDPRSQSFEVLVDLSGTDVPAGSVVRVELPLGEPQAMIAVPRDALIIRGAGMAVFRVTAENTAERVPVTTGVADGDWVAVEGSPLTPQDAVVVRGGETLQDGRPVNVVGTRTAWNSASPASSSSP